MCCVIAWCGTPHIGSRPAAPKPRPVSCTPRIGAAICASSPNISKKSPRRASTIASGCSALMARYSRRIGVSPAVRRSSVVRGASGTAAARCGARIFELALTPPCRPAHVQLPCTRVDHLRGVQFAGSGRARRQPRDLVLACPPVWPAVFGDAVDEDLHARADVEGVARRGDLPLDGEQMVEAFLLHAATARRPRDGPRRSRGAPSTPARWTVSKRTSRISGSVPANSASVSPQNPTMMSVLSASRGPTVPDCCVDLGAVLVDAVQAAHPPEQVVVTGLHRKVQLLADGRQVAHRLEQLRDRVTRVGREESKPPQPGHRVDCREQLRQARPMLGVVIRVDVLSQQRHLAHALGRRAARRAPPPRAVGGSAPARERMGRCSTCTSRCSHP